VASDNAHAGKQPVEQVVTQVDFPRNELADAGLPDAAEAGQPRLRWRPTIERNLNRLRGTITGQPHSRNLDRWNSLVEHGDVLGLHRVLTGLDRDSVEMREVSPMGDLIEGVAEDR